MSHSEKINKLNSFVENFNAIENDLISEERSSLENIYKEKKSVQGEFEFGEDFDHFQLILCYAMKNDEAK